jgi:hypothetical protein
MQPMVAVSNPAAQSGYRDNASPTDPIVTGAHRLRDSGAAKPAM